MKPLAIDLYAGLGGWTDGLLAEGYEVIGFDIERHVYSDHQYPAQLVLQDVLTLHGSQFKDAMLIVASPPCQEFSYMAMPWSRAKQIERDYLSGTRDVKKLTALFDACFRIQREAIEAAGHYIPLVVENVCGAQPWVGRSRWNYGSYHLWGDVPALMPMTVKRELKNGPDTKWRENRCNEENRMVPSGTKNNGGSWFNVAHNTTSDKGNNTVKRIAQEMAGVKGSDGYERDHQTAFGWKKPKTSSHSNARKAASAMIAKIPLTLARHIAKTWYPREL